MKSDTPSLGEQIKYQNLLHESQTKVKEVNSTKQDTNSESGDPTNGEAWYDGTEYKCNFCPLAHPLKSRVVQHVNKYHKDKASTGLGFTIVRENHYKCKLCSHTIVRSPSMIKLHLSKNHDMTFDKYQALYEKQPVFDPSQPPPKSVMWYDRCAWQCQSCKFGSWIYSRIKEHLQKCATSSSDKDAAMKTVVTNLYSCKICHFTMEHKAKTILAHLKKNHSMSPGEYSEKYEPGK